MPTKYERQRSRRNPGAQPLDDASAVSDNTNGTDVYPPPLDIGIVGEGATPMPAELMSRCQTFTFVWGKMIRVRPTGFLTGGYNYGMMQV